MSHSSAGDPDGRRLARKRAALLAEAGLVARSLGVLLRRSGHADPDIEQLCKDLKASERAELQRGYGHLAPRSRYKGNAPHPLIGKHLTDLLYLDESGRSVPEPNQPNADYFALGAIALDDTARDDYCQRADVIKQAFFGRVDFALHEPYMRVGIRTPRAELTTAFAEMQNDRANSMTQLLS